MAVTLRQIAERSCVSPALVSRVLNNKPGVWASPETRQRILDTAQALNYQPSATARALVTGRTMQIAISSADSSWHRGQSGRLLEVSGLIDAAANFQYRVLVLPSQESHANRGQFEALLHSKICDGVCLYSNQADKGLYNWLSKHEIPFVVIGNPEMDGLPYVDHDNYEYAYSSVAWLVERGHRHIGWGASLNEAVASHFVRELRRGYRTALGDLGGEGPIFLESREANQFLENVGQPGAPTALITRGLASTIQWSMALQMRGVKLPTDFTVLAHIDTTELSFLQRSGLASSLACHVHDPRHVGQGAARMLIQVIEGGASPLQTILVSPPSPQWGRDIPEE